MPGVSQAPFRKSCCLGRYLAVTDGTPFAVWFLSVITCGLADLALTATWRPALFRCGPVLYRREVSRIVATPRLPVRRLRICFRTSFCIPIEFKRQSPEECFFRERILLCNCNCYIGYFPVLVGRITLDGSRAAVEGRPRWGYLLMLLVFVVGLSLLFQELPAELNPIRVHRSASCHLEVHSALTV